MNAWTLTYSEWNPDQQPLREALCTLGNGYFATRGAAEEVDAGGAHYPGTYLAGGYNRLETEIAGRLIENEDLVNWPNWLSLTFRHKGGEWFSLDDVEILEFKQELNIKHGILSRRIRFRDREDRQSTLCMRRIVHMTHQHVAAIEWSLRPENWSGTIDIRSRIDGGVENSGVARYSALASKHLECMDCGRTGEDSIFLSVRTRQSRVEMTQVARTQLFEGEEPAPSERRLETGDEQVSDIITVKCKEFHTLRAEKIVSLYTSRDHAIAEAGLEARKAVAHTAAFGDLLEKHVLAWEHLWHRCDIEIEGQVEAQRILRLHIFHLLQTTSVNTLDLDVGVPARGWHGEAYRGHIFWDEMFIFPFLNLHIPELTRHLLIYRFRRLPEACKAAQRIDCCGALYPWQSGSNGREESQEVHLNPKSGRWVPDNTHLQRHVNVTIVFNIWQYYQATGDTDFIAYYGGKMILEIARMWESLVTFNPKRDRYEILGVVGPDEYHTAYPDSDRPGLDNNAYTNVMVAWLFRFAQHALELLSENRRRELLEDLDIREEDIFRWQDISKRMFVPFHGDGIISQFEGYDQLEEFDWEGYKEKYGDIQRLDRILEAEGKSPNRYKAGKQADVLMLFYLFSSEELEDVFSHLGYPFDPETIPKNIEYYEARTSHGSTLSRIVHSWVLSRSHRERSWTDFEQALKSDVADIQGGTTPEGIHLGAMAGTVNMVQRGYLGMVIRGNVLWLNPCLPDALTRIKLRFRYRGHWLWTSVSHDEIIIGTERDGPIQVNIGILDKVVTLNEGSEKRFKLEPACSETGGYAEELDSSASDTE